MSVNEAANDLSALLRMMQDPAKADKMLADLTAAKQEADAALARLEVRQKQVRAAEATQVERGQRLAGRETEIVKREQALDARQAKHDADLANLIRKEKDLSNKADYLGTYLSDLTRRESKVSGRERAIALKESEANGKLAAIEAKVRRVIEAWG
jgi:hypothetical protein